MDKLKKLEEEIAVLQKEKEKEELRIEVDKLKKVVIEETIVKRIIIDKQYPYDTPNLPQCPQPPFEPPYRVWCGTDQNAMY